MTSKRWLAAGAALTGAALVFAVWRTRRNPSPYAYRKRSVEIPRPFLTRGELREILAPRPDERVLEVGPGKGYYSLETAALVSPGVLEVFDVQKEMLDHVSSRARECGVENLVPTLGDAARLPYSDDVFDAAYLVAVLGEVPEKERAVRELRRVVKSGGRVVFGEAITDPHRVSSERLRAMAEAAGLRFERTSGGLLGTFHRFVV